MARRPPASSRLPMHPAAAVGALTGDGMIVGSGAGPEPLARMIDGRRVEAGGGALAGGVDETAPGGGAVGR